MLKDNMIMKHGIVHILDSVKGEPVLSDYEFDLGSDLCDFLKAHIEKFTESDDVKLCQFSNESEVCTAIIECTPDNFVETSKVIALRLFDIMNTNISIPPADVAMVIFGCEGKDYLGVLKFNYKSSYTHSTEADDENSHNNEIVLQRAILPSQGQKLTEAFVVDLESGELQVTEKKYEVNGEKRLYFSELFLECMAPLSEKSKLDILDKTISKINRKYFGDNEADHIMDTKYAIYRELEENGSICIETIKEKIFEDSPEMQEEFMEKMGKYNLDHEIVEPKCEQTTKKFYTQNIKTASGVEVKIPMDEYENRDHVEISVNNDGTYTITIKNVEIQCS